MDLRSLHRQMTHYNRWKRQLDGRLQRFEQWGKAHRFFWPKYGKNFAPRTAVAAR